MKKILLIFIIILCYVNYSCAKFEKMKFELQQIQVQNGINGNFFLGCGTIKNRMNFIIYIKYENKFMLHKNF